MQCINNYLFKLEDDVFPNFLYLQFLYFQVHK
jgi:hypothetical protein